MRALFVLLILCFQLSAARAQAPEPPPLDQDALTRRPHQPRDRYNPLHLAFVRGAALASMPPGLVVVDEGPVIRGVAVAGYKAGLTTAAAQARFATDAPLLGVLFSTMLLDDGAEIDIAATRNLRWEADFLLVVGDDAINTAATREQALATLRGYRPFIEVPTLGPDPASLTAERLAALNVGAWRGVAGPERSLAHDAATIEALGAMRVRAFGASGALLGDGKGTDTLGHPLDAVLWVRDALKARGGRLRPGDVISVGAFTPLTPPKPGQTITVRYEGLPGDPEVSVSFR